MGENKTGTWRNVKKDIDVALELIPLVLFFAFFTAVLFFIVVVVQGAIVSVLWNISMPTMFGLNKITLFNAFVLVFTIECLKIDYVDSAEKLCESIVKKYPENMKKETARIFSSIITGVIVIVLLLITAFVVKYFWNYTLPQMINYELIKINYMQAFGFSFLFHKIFGTQSSNNLKEDKEEDEEASEVAEDDVEIEKVESEVVIDDNSFFDR